MKQLYLHRPDGPPRCILLDMPHCLIGRSRRNDLVLNDSQVSRHHAVIELFDDEAWIIDIGSRNGVWVNGEQVEVGRLRHGALIQLGATRLEFAERPTQPSTQPSFGAEADSSLLFKRVGRMFWRAERRSRP